MYRTIPILLLVFPLWADTIELRQGRVLLTLSSPRLMVTGRKIPLSDVLTLSLRIAGPAALEVEVDALEVNAKLWQFKVVNPSNPTERRWQFDPLRPGKLPLPVISVRYRDRPGEEWVKARWDSLIMDVIGPKDQQKAEIKGDLPLELIPDPPSKIAAISYREILFVFLALLLTGTLLLLSRRRRKQSPPSADQRALQQLDQQNNVDPGKLPVHVSAILRAYLEERYGLPVTSQTTEEFLPKVHQSIQLSESVLVDIDSFCRLCDLMKFAGSTATSVEAANLVDQAKRIIEATRVRSVT